MPEDVEGKTETQDNTDSEGGVYKSNKTGWFLICLKIIELIFCIVCVGLLSEPAQDTFPKIRTQFHHITLAYSSFVTYIIVNSILIIGRVFGEQVGLRTSLLLSSLGACLFFVAAILLFVDHPNLQNYIFYPRDYQKNLWAASASFALLNAVVFVIDTVFTFLKRDDFD